MAINTSTIPAIRAAILALLANRATIPGNALANVSLCDGPPEPAVLERDEHICLLRTHGAQRQRAMNRASQPREERYAQMIEISVSGATRSDQVTLGNRAFALLAELELGLRALPSLNGFYNGGGQIMKVVVGAEDYDTFADDTRRESRLTVGVDVHARI